MLYKAPCTVLYREFPHSHYLKYTADSRSLSWERKPKHSPDRSRNLTPRVLIATARVNLMLSVDWEMNGAKRHSPPPWINTPLLSSLRRRSAGTISSSVLPGVSQIREPESSNISWSLESNRAQMFSHSGRACIGVDVIGTARTSAILACYNLRGKRLNTVPPGSVIHIQSVT